LATGLRNVPDWNIAGAALDLFHFKPVALCSCCQKARAEMKMELDDLPKPKPIMVIGEVLDVISVAELEDRITALEAEIQRVRAEIARKTASKSAADAFFKI
jgi:uncharacterized small protein (DUF1192 family)